MSDADLLRLYDSLPADQLDDWIAGLSDADYARLNTFTRGLDRNQAGETEYVSVVGAFVSNLGNIDSIQTSLDIAGVIPIVGEIADGVNGLIYLARGDRVNAGLSFISMIPLAGDYIGKGGKILNAVKKGGNFGSTAKVAVKGNVPSRADFHIALRERGFEFHHTTKGRYVEYRHGDGSKVWIRPDGEIIRMGPKVTPSGGGKAYHPRLDALGNPIGSHNPGEFVVPLPGF